MSDEPRSYRAVARADAGPCPRCGAALAELGELPGARACAECGGVFLGEGLVERLESAADLDDLVARSGATVALIPVVSEVRYLRCPQCGGTMNRASFGRRSGIVVDTCKAHGTFFDAGELVAAVEFVASGQLARSRAEAQAARAAEKDRLRKEALAIAASEVTEVTPTNRRFASLLHLFRFLG